MLKEQFKTLGRRSVLMQTTNVAGKVAAKQFSPEGRAIFFFFSPSERPGCSKLSYFSSEFTTAKHTAAPVRTSLKAEVNPMLLVISEETMKLSQPAQKEIADREGQT